MNQYKIMSKIYEHPKLAKVSQFPKIQSSSKNFSIIKSNSIYNTFGKFKEYPIFKEV